MYFDTTNDNACVLLHVLIQANEAPTFNDPVFEAYCNGDCYRDYYCALSQCPDFADLANYIRIGTYVTHCHTAHVHLHTHTHHATQVVLEMKWAVVVCQSLQTALMLLTM